MSLRITGKILECIADVDSRCNFLHNSNFGAFPSGNSGSRSSTDAYSRRGLWAWWQILVIALLSEDGGGSMQAQQSIEITIAISQVHLSSNNYSFFFHSFSTCDSMLAEMNTKHDFRSIIFYVILCDHVFSCIKKNYVKRKTVFFFFLLQHVFDFHSISHHFILF